MEVDARTASTDDVPDLDTLAVEAIEELTPHRGGDLWRASRARPMPPTASFERDLGDDRAHVVVGTIDGVSVGYGVVRLVTLADDRLLGVIEDLFTLEGARGVSVGEHMMDALIDWATAQGCAGVDSMALPGDRATKNFFESFGLVARAITVHRALPDR